uniref:Potassium/proton antiporter CemA n=1 Tax=Adiantum reniforme var. sinense TaxID=269174 RepID=A0A7M3UJ73_9MONI|nr:envelope membrane protein [Adiantum reniforme var. sinense]QOH99638.1 chloroplast envelope membrane protein [Adiantum reniforme var. sinense]UNZ94072.1 envelope membrane protein [Adiantum reniforme var. sinense]
MKLCHWKRKLIRWFLNTPYRSLERAYEASKHLQPDSLSLMQLKSVPLAAGNSSKDRTASKTAVSNKSRYVICFSLLEHRFSLFLRGIYKYSGIYSCTDTLCSFSRKRYRSHLYSADNYSARRCLDPPPHKLPNLSIFDNIFFRSRSNSYVGGKTLIEGEGVIGISEYKLEGNSVSAGGYKLNNLEKMNRKLAWIEATSSEFSFWGKPRSRQISLFRTEKKLIEEPFNYELGVSHHSPVAYESISLVPRSVIRTLSRFEAELANQSNSLVHNNFDLAKNQAYVSLQYVGFFLLLFPFQVAIENWFLEPRIRRWWNLFQSQVFLNPLQEEKALRQLREAEALLWLNDIVTDNLADTQLQHLDADARDETTRLAITYDEPNIQLLLQLATNTISIAILFSLLLLGRKRLAVLNSWIQESFYSLNDTMKAFSILLLTDLCVGFHSPHGWEILVESLFEHFGLTPNKYVTPCFVSTFPVILDTLFKYWIFRHLNRTSPSIVATYHTMSE